MRATATISSTKVKPSCLYVLYMMSPHLFFQMPLGPAAPAKVGVFFTPS